MTEFLRVDFAFLVFPGFLFTAVAGVIASFVDRKVSARVQWRKGPPLLQPVYDFVKLLGKEITVPAGAPKITFLAAPLFGLSAITIVSTIIWTTLLNPSNTEGFVGDLIVVLYLFAIPALSIIVGAFASKNPIASIGASREMKLLLGYELPFIISIIVPVIKSDSIKLGGIVQHQLSSGAFAGSISGIIALIVSIICIQAKMGLIPFDVAEAEQEIIAGPLIEYSGPSLAVFKLMKWIMLFTVPSFVVLLFFPGAGFLSNFLRYVILLVVAILIKNTNPRARIDQAIKFFWTYCTIAGVLAVVLALYGL
ncbi:MAG: complex I subunit 1 family protein [Elusimicrobiota bacterium]